MHVVEVDGRRYAQFDRLRLCPGLIHAFSLRPHSVAPRGGAATARNRQQMAADWGFDPPRLRHSRQVHQTTLRVVEAATPPGELPECDAVITTLPGVPLMTFSADCPLILVYDPQRNAVGLAHASWRCTVAGLTSGLVERLIALVGGEPGDLLAGVGPGAGPCCYEVKEDVYAAAVDLPDRSDCFQQRDGRQYFDLWTANRQLLLAAGVKPQNIELAGTCTMCRTDLFYSFRREGQGCGHFGLMAGLR